MYENLPKNPRLISIEADEETQHVQFPEEEHKLSVVVNYLDWNMEIIPPMFFWNLVIVRCAQQW